MHSVATDQEDLYVADDPVGSDNDKYLLEYALRADKIIMASGKAKPKFKHQWLARLRAVTKLLLDNNIELHYLQLTDDGFPRHPLYLRSVITPSKMGDCTVDTVMSERIKTKPTVNPFLKDLEIASKVLVDPNLFILLHIINQQAAG